MDTRTEQASDKALEKELLFNERTFEHPTWGTLKIRRPTPQEDFAIAEYRTARWNEDMESGKYRFREELERTYGARGVWTPDMQTRIEDLTKRTGEAMGLLDALGFDSFEGLAKQYEANVSALFAFYPDDEAVREAIGRYYDLNGEHKTADRRVIEDASVGTAVDDLLEQGDELRAQLNLLNEMATARKELHDLSTKQARLFAGTVESRADRAEEIARLYFCTETPEGKRVFSSIEGLWSARAEDVEALALEMSYFIHGVTAAFRKTLGKYGFTRRLADTGDSSVDSPGQQTPNSAGESAASEPTPSSPATEPEAASSTPS